MNKDKLARLREEQDKAVSETDEKIEQWKKFKTDYEAVIKKLSTLPDSLSQDTLVQFGPLAFMPGQLVHTNEVLVLLGDNWFAERSAKQAIDIIKRRIKQIDKQLNDLQEQKKLLTPRMTFTSELQDLAEERGGMKEIVEEYDEEKEKKWREEHRIRIREHKKKMKEESEKIKSSKKDSLTDTELWAKLDALEKIETERKELERMSDTEEQDFPSYERDSKKISWEDEVSGQEKNISGRVDKEHDRMAAKDSDDSSVTSEDDEETSSDGYTGDEEQTVSDEIPKTKITFTHTKPPQQNKDSSDSDADNPEIASPRDIYKLFTKPAEPKSILKKKSVKVEPLVSSKDDASTHKEVPDIAKDTPKPFSGTVIENSVPGALPSTAPVSMDTQPARRVSKFRAERQKQAATPR